MKRLMGRRKKRGSIVYGMRGCTAGQEAELTARAGGGVKARRAWCASEGVGDGSAVVRPVTLHKRNNTRVYAGVSQTVLQTVCINISQRMGCPLFELHQLVLQRIPNFRAEMNQVMVPS
jgi:hypothetical protein